MLSSLTLAKLHLRTYTAMCMIQRCARICGYVSKQCCVFAVTDPESRSPTRQLQMTTCRANRKAFLHSFRVHALDTPTHPTEIDPSTTIYTHTYVYMNIQYMHTGTHFECDTTFISNTSILLLGHTNSKHKATSSHTSDFLV